MKLNKFTKSTLRKKKKKKKNKKKKKKKKQTLKYVDSKVGLIRYTIRTVWHMQCATT